MSYDYECACALNLDGDNSPDAFSESDRKAMKEHRCCECGRTIQVGEVYRYDSGIWDGRPASYKTCCDCLSIRQVFFKCGYLYGTVWRDLHDYADNADGEIIDSNVTKLTAVARDKLFALVEEIWKKNGVIPLRRT